MTKTTEKKPQTIKTGKAAGKVVAPKKKKAATAAAAPMPYFRAIDLLMACVGYARKGQPKRAVKALADAVQDPDIDEAMELLDQQQQQGLDQIDDLAQDDVVFDDQGQQQMSATLARLITASQSADEADEEDDEDEDDADEEEEDEEQDSEESSAETAGEDGQDSEDDLDITVDDEDAEEQQVQASVAARLERAARNKARRS